MSTHAHTSNLSISAKWEVLYEKVISGKLSSKVNPVKLF